MSSPSSHSTYDLHSPRAGTAGQVDRILDSVFADLEQKIEPPGFEPNVDDYPYAFSRPPLGSRRSQPKGWLVMIAMTVVMGTTGIVFWLSGRPQISPTARLDAIAPSGRTVSPRSDANRLDLSQFEMGWLNLGGSTPTAETTAAVTETADRSKELGSEGQASTPTEIPAAASSSQPGAAQPPPAALAQPTPPLLSTLPKSSPQMKLVGIIHEPGEPIALILVNDVVQQVPVGHPVQPGWQVVSIAPQGVAVSDGRQRYLLQLGLGQIL